MISGRYKTERTHNILPTYTPPQIAQNLVKATSSVIVLRPRLTSH